MGLMLGDSLLPEDLRAKGRYRTADLVSIVRQSFAAHVRCCGPSDQVEVTTDERDAMVSYYVFEASRSSQRATYVEFRCDSVAAEVWICRLEVAPDHQHKGIGRGLVSAVEGVARKLGLTSMKLNPVFGTESFWRKAGFLPAGGPSRTLEKELA
jgi:GNAT superfamily N-acetyltransferase